MITAFIKPIPGDTKIHNSEQLVHIGPSKSRVDQNIL